MIRIEAFKQRLDAGKSLAYTYEASGLEGLIEIWKHEERVVLTWEECPAGAQYDESRYVRDQRLEFATVEEVLAFLAQHGIDATRFEPA